MLVRCDACGGVASCMIGIGRDALDQERWFMLCRRCLADGGLRACRHCELETELVSIRGGWRFLREPQPGVIGQALLGGFLDLPGDRCPDHRGTG